MLPRALGTTVQLHQSDREQRTQGHPHGVPAGPYSGGAGPGALGKECPVPLLQDRRDRAGCLSWLPGDNVGVTVWAEMSHPMLCLAARPQHLLLAQVWPRRGRFLTYSTGTTNITFETGNKNKSHPKAGSSPHQTVARQPRQEALMTQCLGHRGSKPSDPTGTSQPRGWTEATGDLVTHWAEASPRPHREPSCHSRLAGHRTGPRPHSRRAVRSDAWAALQALPVPLRQQVPGSNCADRPWGPTR